MGASIMHNNLKSNFLSGGMSEMDYFRLIFTTASFCCYLWYVSYRMVPSVHTAHGESLEVR